MPERHRELAPFAGLTGNARSATGAQYRARGPCRRAEARKCTADRGQCVSAWGRNSNAGSAELASFAAWTRRERWGWPTRSPQSANGLARCSRHRWSSHRTWHRRSGRTMPRAHHPFHASSAKEGAGTMVKPWAAPLPTNSQGTQNVRNHRRHQRHGEASLLEGLAFSCAMHAGRQLDLAEAASVCCRSEALARPKTAV